MGKLRYSNKDKLSTHLLSGYCSFKKQEKKEESKDEGEDNLKHKLVEMKCNKRQAEMT